MQIRRGIGVAPGYAIGPAAVVPREAFENIRRNVSEAGVAAERERFLTTYAQVVSEVRAQVETIARKTGGVVARILEAHLALLSDTAFRDEVVRSIEQHRYTAEFAVRRYLQTKREAISSAATHAFADRIVQDLRELEYLLLRRLLGTDRRVRAEPGGPVVWVAHYLSPAEVAALDRRKTLGILLATGGRSSHSAIVARSMGFATVVGVEGIMDIVSDGRLIVLDGSSGTVILDPDEGTLKRYRALDRNLRNAEERLIRELRALPARTKDGVDIRILANIEFPEEIDLALERGAEGVGLYRTEFLFLGQPEPPDEARHYEAYQQAAAKLGDRPLVIRTLDLGADKVFGYSDVKEENPLLGVRAIRLCLDRRDLFEPQIRAIIRAASFGSVAMMVPLVSSVEEIREVRKYIERVEADLMQSGESFRRGIGLGVMVETPAAALTADLLAPHVEFFSIGTNDLVAFAIAVDRNNERLEGLYRPEHPAVLRMIRSVIEAGERAGRMVSLCGEIASDPKFTMLLVGLGLRTFSVVAPAIPEVKKVIRSITHEEARVLAQRLLAQDSAEATREVLEEETAKILPDVVV